MCVSIWYSSFNYYGVGYVFFGTNFIKSLDVFFYKKGSYIKTHKRYYSHIM